MPIQIMNNVGMDSKNIVSSDGIFRDSVAMNSVFGDYYRQCFL